MVKLSSQKKMEGREEAASKQMNRELKAQKVSLLYVRCRRYNLMTLKVPSLLAVNVIDVTLTRQRHQCHGAEKNGGARGGGFKVDE